MPAEPKLPDDLQFVVDALTAVTDATIELNLALYLSVACARGMITHEVHDQATKALMAQAQKRLREKEQRLAAAPLN